MQARNHSLGVSLETLYAHPFPGGVKRHGTLLKWWWSLGLFYCCASLFEPKKTLQGIYTCLSPGQGSDTDESDDIWEHTLILAKPFMNIASDDKSFCVYVGTRQWAHLISRTGILRIGVVPSGISLWSKCAHSPATPMVRYPTASRPRRHPSSSSCPPQSTHQIFLPSGSTAVTINDQLFSSFNNGY